MWLTFKRPSKDWKLAPVYFFELGPDMLRYGLGYYSADKATMDLFRHTLLRRPQAFLEVAECCRAPFELVGESYKRPRVLEQAPEIATWYNRKSFAVMATDNQVEKLFSANLVATLTQSFQQLEPLYQWLMQVRSDEAGRIPKTYEYPSSFKHSAVGCTHLPKSKLLGMSELAA